MAAAKVVALVGTSLISSAITYFTLVEPREKEAVAKSKEGGERIKTVVVTRSEEEKAKEKAEKWLPLRETKNNPPLNPNSLASKLSINDVDCDGKRVLVRVDYNVPMKKDKDGNQVVADPRRIEETVDTLQLLLAKKGPKGGIKCIVLIAHLGQPTGKYNRADFTLQPCVKVLEDYLKVPVTFLPDCVGPDVEQAINDCKPGSVFLCENLRFHTEEIGSGEDEKGQKIKCKPDAIAKFQDSLTRLGDVFVFEAFGAAHRPHSSINGIKIPVRVAGLLVQKELGIFSQVLNNPKRPCLAVLGGAKVSDKIQVIENMLDLVDEMIIGGGMAYTFKKMAHKVDIGSSIFDKEGANAVERILKKAQERGVKMHFPVDHVIADKFSADARTGVTDDVAGVPAGWMALDVGPKSRANFSAVCERAETIIWNGPMGVFEKGPFAAGTLSLMCDLCVATKRGATTIIGGGETGQASNAFHYRHSPCADQVTHVSTGGGSSLVLLEGKQLPGVQGITERADYVGQSSASGQGSVAATAAVFESGSKPGKAKDGKEKKKN